MRSKTSLVVSSTSTTKFTLHTLTVNYTTGHQNQTQSQDFREKIPKQKRTWCKRRAWAAAATAAALFAAELAADWLWLNPIKDRSFFVSFVVKVCSRFAECGGGNQDKINRYWRSKNESELAKLVIAMHVQKKVILINSSQQLLIRTKITNSHLPGRREENVFRLQVAMNDATVMQVLHTTYHDAMLVSWFWTITWAVDCWKAIMDAATWFDGRRLAW